MKYTIADIAEIINASWLQQGTGGIVSHLLIDSRKLLFPGDTIFFALQSSNRNGHQFIPRLYQQGVRHFVISETIDPSGLPGANLLMVNNTLDALQKLAASHRGRFSIPVIGITGSNGKTIVKEWLNQLLEPDFTVVRSPRSYNSQIGVPLSVWLMEQRHQLGIFEAGISMKGEMKALANIIRPNIGVFTNLGLAHSDGFNSMAEKLAEKWQLFDESEVIIYKRDNGIVDEFIAGNARVNQKLFSWGFGNDATMVVLIKDKHEGHTICNIQSGENSFDLVIPFADEASIENALTCCAVLLWIGTETEHIVDRIAQLRSVAMRLELKEGINHCSVINDSYSADLSSLVIALDFLSQQKQHRKKTVILSDIPQTAISAGQLYRHIAGMLKLHGVDRLVAIGTEISQHVGDFSDQQIEVKSFLSTEEFEQHFDELVFSEETILVKGARKFAFENLAALLEMQVHQTVLEINLNTMLANLKQYQQILRPGTKLMAMVKAFSYGSGSFEIANLLQFHGVDYLAVAYTDEGVALRKAGIHLPVMVMNAAPNGFNALVEYNLEPVLYSLQLYKKFAFFTRQEGIPEYPVHIEIETGMNRLGFSADDMPELLDLLQLQQFKVQSIFSHLAASEDAAHDAFTRQQVERFTSFCSKAEIILATGFLRHIGNTAAIFRFPQWQFDMVRLGIGLYGIDPAHGDRIRLEEVSTLKTTIAQIKKLLPGETVGYSRKGIITRPSVIATVRIGYADGYPRKLGNGTGKMLVGKQLAPVIGSICMDMTMIDITGIDGVKEGDEVIVFGKGLPVSAVAEWAGTIPYEILTGISQRVKRIYYQD
ncbi:bifunctional UDP-N-acetylmuramoyl-tripeptide:D-alanyl-D-alanine ligase/alanine racemase [Flavihumibacter profundi]|uniref:bifunctional UDP-N-acetylmuramoyl-tripeptide:D-alanyl-D-alanine ligase/alanine racemase n=1 Tax=Flavihumibacter profundi TaxID=2716883 RepID=UPI001CC5EA34|nr:bifunctional UDP-N-acetylmuramoyl-tripeptide:D-alanyl-D-alanine ligase/alanine racemase [Flavihumibacter profundi]MBZ5858472.1 bifunctional UDP-N-acetylmuramoyl-tripeptide:D-alanyl-D-alanine ligase/alanine racemase [Flavihumibacter profundi]